MPVEKYIKEPDELWEMWESYKHHVKSNPKFLNVLNQRSGTIVPMPLEPPLTEDGFRAFCSRVYSVTVKHYLENTEDRYEAFSSISARIREERRDDHLSGGMVGIYKENITARLNGLTDKVEQNINATITQITGMEIK